MFYAYKKSTDESIGDGFVRRELALLQFNTKAERTIMAESDPSIEPVRVAEIPARHMHTFRQFAAPLKGGSFASVVDSGVN